MRLRRNYLIPNYEDLIQLILGILQTLQFNHKQEFQEMKVVTLFKFIQMHHVYLLLILNESMLLK